jgi:Zn ribbon nucleic-acid-binding protein
MSEECPHCGEPLKIKKWHDDVGLVEIKKDCSCGYVYHWAYGTAIADSDLEKAGDLK